MDQKFMIEYAFENAILAKAMQNAIMQVLTDDQKLVFKNKILEEVKKEARSI